MPSYYLEAFTITLGLVLLMAEAFIPSKQKAWVGIAAVVGLLGIFALNLIVIGPDAAPNEPWAKWKLWNFYQVDALSRFFKGFAILTTAFVILMSVDYRKVIGKFTDKSGSEQYTPEFYILPIFTCAGMMFLASAKDLAGAFVSLELITVSFYILVAFMRRNVGSLEAGVKYLILGALSTGFIVYGIAWVYGSTGSMAFSQFAESLYHLKSATPLLFGIALILVGLAFKVGAFPMHIWIPDVYQGAPTPISAFLSVGSKAAGFVLLIRFLQPFLESELTRQPVLLLLLILAIATLLFGNFAAIPQTNVKRLFAYSSIAHAGFLLLALAAHQKESVNAVSSVQIVAFYLATYLIMTLGSFFILSQIRIQRDGETLAHFNGLGKTNPLVALSMTMFLASLAGVPLTAGFWGKFFVFSIAIDKGLWLAIGVASIGAALGFYYYFNVMRSMWWNEPSQQSPVVLPLITKICVCLLVIATLVIGLLPQPIFALLTQ